MNAEEIAGQEAGFWRQALGRLAREVEANGWMSRGRVRELAGCGSEELRCAINDAARNWPAGGELRITVLTAERDAAVEAVAVAEILLKRVVIQGGAQAWSGREMLDWCCDYKNWTNGYRSQEQLDREHSSCGHRRSPDSTDAPSARAP
ncbi:MAG: hypothetical protein DRQ55_16555 [Planctomycetota bacterium]|nr:MAG: hypothetical protein DRQ55_16555 [Planctomycetota bacterium]RKZ10267.1 MAG: hypothetical protein DRQ32_07370 [bacterium]